MSASKRLMSGVNTMINRDYKKPRIDRGIVDVFERALIAACAFSLLTWSVTQIAQFLVTL